MKRDKKVLLMILEIHIIGSEKTHLLKVKFFPGGIMDIKYQDSRTELLLLIIIHGISLI